MEEPTLNKSIILLVIIGIILALCRWLVIINFNIFPDESIYYWQTTRDPMGFCPHPPAIPFFVRLGVSLLGQNEMGVRLVSYLISLVIIFCIYSLAREIGGKWVAIGSVFLYLSIPIYFAFGVISTPDGAQLFFWVMALWTTYQALKNNRWYWWIITGVIIGTGLYIKYILVLYFPSLLFCLWLSPQWRNYLRTPGPYLGLIVAILLFAPIAIWQDYSTGWSTLRYHLSERQHYNFPSLKSFFMYHLAHLAYYSPVTYVACVSAMIWCGIKSFRLKKNHYIFLFSFSAVTYFFFFFIAFVTQRILSREQWDAMAYIPAIIAIMIYAQDKISIKSIPGIRINITQWLIATGGLGFVIIGIILFEGFSGQISGMVKERPAFSKFIGWKQMAEGVDLAFVELPNNESEFILANSFHSAFEYSFYGQKTDRIYVLDHPSTIKYGLAPLLQNTGVTGDYLANEIGHNAIFVTEELFDIQKNTNQPQDPFIMKLKQMFKEVNEKPDIQIVHYGRVIKRFRVYYCINLQNPILS